MAPNGTKRGKQPEPGFATVKIPEEFALWLRDRAHAEGKFIYRVLEDLVAGGLGGHRPWAKK